MGESSDSVSVDIDIVSFGGKVSDHSHQECLIFFFRLLFFSSMQSTLFRLLLRSLSYCIFCEFIYLLFIPFFPVFCLM